jgi:sulfite dehydrogenase (quinone) subunit SoeC
MHPAYSVIVFTTSSGAGYGLLVWLAGLLIIGNVPNGNRLAFAGLVLALGLITVGLLSSTSHLGRPERAWRALSQWKTSWLSREGVLAIATYVPAGILLLVWGIAGAVTPLVGGSALLAVPLAIATVWSTGMIYQSLPTIRAWSQPLVAPLYVMLALATGGLLCTMLQIWFGGFWQETAVAVVMVLAATWVLKVRYWTAIDGAERTLDAGKATGLGALGRVRPLDPPHTQANFVMREMGFQVARRHALKLRHLAIGLLFVLPLLLLIVALAAGDGTLASLACGLAVVLAGLGVAIERWLFFAEAEHVVMLYYGREAA